MAGQPVIFQAHVLAVDVTDLAYPIAKCGPIARSVFGRRSIHDRNHRHRRLLRPRRERPCRRSAEQRDELAPVHSITSSASESRLSEILMPSASAVLRLITVSNLVGCSTGRSAGFAPLRIFAV